MNCINKTKILKPYQFFIISVILLTFISKAPCQRNEYAITQDTVQILIQINDSIQVMKIPPDEQIRIREMCESYYFVERFNGEIGWSLSEKIEIIERTIETFEINGGCGYPCYTEQDKYFSPEDSIDVETHNIDSSKMRELEKRLMELSIEAEKREIEKRATNEAFCDSLALYLEQREKN